MLKLNTYYYEQDMNKLLTSRLFLKNFKT